ncbi:MAG: ribosome small subunit-dependent GTPase A [Bacteroidota bacterium]
MPEGRVVQCVGGFQTVLTPDGRSVVCTARGRLKKERGEIVVGDLVRFAAADGTAVIEEVLPRRNLLRRPLVANVDQAVLVFALRDPAPRDVLIDRFLVTLGSHGLPVVLCLNKTDLAPPREANALADYYGRLGYPVVLTSTVRRTGRLKLLRHLAGLTSVFCGPSGVGKSALLNMIRPGLALRTGEISAKIKRGRHTTRAARLIVLPRGGFVVDTPGYTQVDLAGLDCAGLQACFPEFEGLAGLCRFGGCRHLTEPDCAVRRAVDAGLLPAKRYEHYRLFLSEIGAMRREGR